MSNPTSVSSFPATQRDLSNLKQTATDAVADLSSTAAVHTTKAQNQIKELAGHVQEEGAEQVEQIKGSMNELVNAARNYALERPLACMGTAFAGGFLLAFCLSRSRN
jgi:ElaB/YqjD/DUF883 family membrane-anchored ribosome-binding protein